MSTCLYGRHRPKFNAEGAHSDIKNDSFRPTFNHAYAAEGYAVSAAEVALAWLLTRPAISSLIIGGRTEDQLRTNLRCVDLKLSKQDVERLEAISRPRLLYPYWHQRLMASSRLGPAELSLLGPHLQYS